MDGGDIGPLEAFQSAEQTTGELAATAGVLALACQPVEQHRIGSRLLSSGLRSG